MINEAIMNIKQLFRNKIFTNMRWLVSGRILQMAIALVINMVTARYLGVNNYGIINYIASYVSFFTPICSLGLESILIKELVDKPECQGETIGTALGMRIISSILSMAAITIFLLFIDRGNAMMLGVALVQSMILIFNTADLFEFWYQSRLESKVSVTVRTAGYLITAVYKIAILVFQKSIYWFAFTNTLDMIIAFVLLNFAYRKSGGQKLTFNFVTGKKMLKIIRNYICLFDYLFISS